MRSKYVAIAHPLSRVRKCISADVLGRPTECVAAPSMGPYRGPSPAAAPLDLLTRATGLIDPPKLASSRGVRARIPRRACRRAGHCWLLGAPTAAQWRQHSIVSSRSAYGSRRTEPMCRGLVLAIAEPAQCGIEGVLRDRSQRGSNGREHILPVPGDTTEGRAGSPRPAGTTARDVAVSSSSSRRGFAIRHHRGRTHSTQLAAILPAERIGAEQAAERRG